MPSIALPYIPRPLLKPFIQWNIRVSNWLRPKSLKHHQAYDRYSVEVIRTLLHPDIKRVLDVGAGKNWPFDPKIKELSNIHLIGVDASAEEMTGNRALDERIAVDASSGLGVEDGSLDLITGRAVIEHVPDVDAFLANCMRALRPGGLLILTFINGYSPPALVNRMLPENLAHKLLFTIWPGSEVHQGFRTYYDNTVASKFRQRLSDKGFSLKFEYQSYSSSGYLRFFVPLYIFGLIIDALRFLLGWRDCSAFNLFIASKPRTDGTDDYIDSEWRHR